MHINLGKSLYIFSVYITRIQDYLLNDCDLCFRWCNTVKPAINMANDLPTRLDVLILRLASKHIVEAKYWWFSLKWNGMSEAKNFRYYRISMNERPGQVSRLCSFPLLSCSSKCVRKIYRAQYGNSMFVLLREAQILVGVRYSLRL